MFVVVFWSLSQVQLFWDPVDYSPPGSSVHGISQTRILGGLSFPSPGDIPNPGIKPTSPALAGGFFTAESPEKPKGRPQRRAKKKKKRERKTQ